MPAVPGTASRITAATVEGPSSSITSRRWASARSASCSSFSEPNAERYVYAGWKCTTPSEAESEPTRRREPVRFAVRRVAPWYERYAESTLCRPVCRRAIRTACSLASAPAFVKNTWLMDSGSRSVISRAASDRASLTCCGATVASVSACSRIAATIFGCRWPTFVKTSCPLKSTMGRPSPSHTHDPSASRMVMGVRSRWALHEWNTCARSSSWARRPRSMASSLIRGSRRPTCC